MVERITQNTLVPISIVGACLLSIIGFVVWLTTLSNNVAMYGKMFEAQNQQISEMRRSQENQNNLILNVQIELQTIKGKLEILTLQKKTRGD